MTAAEALYHWEDDGGAVVADTPRSLEEQIEWNMRWYGIGRLAARQLAIIDGHKQGDLR